MIHEQEPLPTNWNAQLLDEPDYAVYTLAQLQDVHERIDRERYPERFARLREELNSRPREIPEVEYGSEMSRKLGVPFDLLGIYRKLAVTVQMSALALALNNMVGELVGVRIVQLWLGLRISFRRNPGGLDHGLALAAYWLILLLLASGGLALWSKSRRLHWALPLGWGLLSFRAKVGAFLWWPAFHGFFNLDLSFFLSSQGEITNVIQIVGVPLALAVIALVTLPDRRRESGSIGAEGDGDMP